MDKILQTMYLRLDSTTKSLSKNAISQLLIKILYANSNSLSENQIISEYKRILNKRKIDETQIKKNIQLLRDDNSINYRKGSYYLSTNKRNKMQLSYQASEERESQIIETYFTPCFSEKQVISDWLSDVTIAFFKLYSNEWIADLCYKKMSAISNSKENILTTIKEETRKNKLLDKKDLDDLSSKYIDFITTKDLNVDQYLWEYGISQFAAQLISSFSGTDEFSIETFRNCKCVLDTNILMNIGLESSDYYSAFKSLEDMFTQLNVEVGILDITKEEYKRTVANKKDEIIRLAEIYPMSVLKETDDQYIKTAFVRHCRSAEDLSRFFSPLMSPPEHIEENVKINLFDDDNNLIDTIDRAQKDEQKKNELNSIYRKITGKDKREPALIHDVGLIAGVNYLREQGKYFILSQELSVNTYAKEKPSVNDLPISIRLETLINVLAVENGGLDIDASDYATLFAAMIRNRLIPNKDVFKVTDLSIMFEKNEHIAQLPEQETIRIAKKIHRERLLGIDDEKISLELTREIQGVKLKIVDELTETKTELFSEKTEKNRYKEQADASTEALRKIIENDYRKILRNNKLIFYFGIPMIIIILVALGFYLYKNSQTTTNWVDYLISISIEIVITVLFICFAAVPKIKKLEKSKEDYIEEEMRSRLNTKMQCH